MFGHAFTATGNDMGLRVLFIFLLGLTSIHADDGARYSPIESVDLLCRTTGAVVHINKLEERMWIAGPQSVSGHEPYIQKFVLTGQKSLFIKAEGQLHSEKVDFLFTLRDLESKAEQSRLRATMRVFDSTGEESALLRFKCEEL